MSELIDGLLRFGLVAFIAWLGCRMAAGWIQTQLDELRYQINQDIKAQLDRRDYDGVGVFDYQEGDE